MDEKKSKSDAKSVGHEAYQDGLQPFLSDFGKELQPSGKRLGKATNKVVNCVLDFLGGTLSLPKTAYEHFCKRLVERLKLEEPKDLCPPKMLIASQVLDHYKFLGEEIELQGLFVNLFASSMLKHSSSKVHPSFVEILKQINSDEAKLLKYMFSSGTTLFPMLEVTAHNPENEKMLIVPHFTNLAELAGCELTEDMDSYIQNLERLKIVETELARVKDEYYAELFNHKRLMELGERGKKHDHRIMAKKGSIRITSFGLNFGAVCIPKPTV